MSERVAIVVGAGELGRATAISLVGAGFTVVAVDRTLKALDELPEGIKREAGDATDSGPGQERHRPDRRRGRPP